MTTSFDPDTTPAWLFDAALAQLGGRPARPPGWLTIETLPPIRVGEHHLDDFLTHAAINALRESNIKQATPLVELLSQHADKSSLSAFSLAVFERWLDAGAKGADRWAMDALVHWGGDAAALRLGPLIRALPAQRKHRRASDTLEVLKAIGTNTAILELSIIARMSRGGKLNTQAQLAMMDVAQQRGLSIERLEDRIVPSLGLDKDWVFDYGPRQFRVVMNSDLKAMLLDESGKSRADLPPAGRTDDAQKAAAAQAQWKLFKKQLRETLKAQGARLESALLTGRLWSIEEFRSLIVEHPILGRMARHLLWGGFDAAGRLRHAFRVNEDREYVCHDESVCVLDGVAGIGLVHPLHLSDEERTAWQAAFDDHELLPPFAQLGRPIYRLSPEEAESRVIRRFVGVGVEAVTLVSILDKHGWDRGRPAVEGVRTHLKWFGGVGLLAVLHYSPGVLPYGIRQEGVCNQTLGECFFVAADVEPVQGFGEADAVDLARVDVVVLCEVLGMLEELRRKSV